MTVTIKVLYDNEVLQQPLKADWGFAALITEDSGVKVLFDAGTKGGILLHNAEVLGEDLSDLSAVVLSHWHSDHAGGLPAVARIARAATFFVPSRPDLHWPDVTLHPVHETPVRITEHVYSTGVVGGIEQALIVLSDSCPFLLTGCAHPGVQALLHAAKAVVEPKAILGGLHDFADFRCLDDLMLVYPCHCTQRKRDILSLFREKAHLCGAGLTVTT